MKNTEIIKVTTAEQLNALYDASALTIEGLAEESIENFLDAVHDAASLKKRRVFVTKGATMNKFYRLHGRNAYPEDLTIVSIMLVDMEHYEPIVTARFEWGGRWFDDIVDNNASHEKHGVRVIKEKAA